MLLNHALTDTFVPDLQSQYYGNIVSLTTALTSTVPARNSLTFKLYRAEQVVIFLPNNEMPRAHVIPCRAKN